MKQIKNMKPYLIKSAKEMFSYFLHGALVLGLVALACITICVAKGWSIPIFIVVGFCCVVYVSAQEAYENDRENSLDSLEGILRSIARLEGDEHIAIEKHQFLLEYKEYCVRFGEDADAYDLKSQMERMLRKD